MLQLAKEPMQCWAVSIKVNAMTSKNDNIHCSDGIWNTVFSSGCHNTKKNAKEIERMQIRVTKVVRSLGAKSYEEWQGRVQSWCVAISISKKKGIAKQKCDTNEMLIF